MWLRLNSAYDGLQEPTRFMVFIVPLTALIVAIHLAPLPLSCLGLLFLVVVLLQRLFYLGSSRG